MGQSALTPHLNINNLHPDLLVVIVFAWSLLRKFEESIVWAFWAGIILDLLTVTPFGIFTVSLLVVTLAAGFWQERLTGDTFILPILLAWPYTILFNATGLLLLQLNGYSFQWGSALTGIIFPVGGLNAAVMAVIYPLLTWLHRLTKSADMTI